MKPSKLRRQITWEAARLMYERRETEYFRAKQKAAQHVHRGWVKPADLPSNAEIRDEIQALARMHEGEGRHQHLREMRLEALRLMRLLHRYRPRLIGSVLTGHIRQGSDIDLHVFADGIDGILAILDQEGMIYDVERKHVRKQGEERTFTHIHIRDRYPFELTVYPSDKVHYIFKSSITGKPIERASIGELEELLAREEPERDLEADVTAIGDQVDRFRVYEALLLPLETVKQSPKYHPEGDALYHSLQVYDLVRDEIPYDEELLTAALLHDIGKAMDPQNHVTAALEALQGYITERTAWFIAHHMEAQGILDGTLGARAHRRLKASEDYEELVLLARCDRAGRRAGVEASELTAALDYLRDLSLLSE